MWCPGVIGCFGRTVLNLQRTRIGKYKIGNLKKASGFLLINLIAIDNILLWVYIHNKGRLLKLI